MYVGDMPEIQHTTTSSKTSHVLLRSPIRDGCKRVCAMPCLAHIIADQHISGLCAQKEPLLCPNVMNRTCLCIARPDLGL